MCILILISFHRWTASHGMWGHKAMMLHKEAVKVRTSPPSATLMSAYMVVMDGEASGAQHPTPDGEGNPNTPLVTITWVGVPCANCKQTLGILWMMSCNSSWGTSTGRSPSDSWMHPRDPPPTPWGNPVGNGDPNVEAWEVTLLRGWEPIGQPLQPSAPIQPDGGWEPRGQPPHPHTHSTQWRCGMSYKHAGHGIATWYPLYKHFQWQSHAR